MKGPHPESCWTEGANTSDTIFNREDGREARVPWGAIRYSDGSRAGFSLSVATCPSVHPTPSWKGYCVPRGFTDFFNPATGNTVFHNRLARDEGAAMTVLPSSFSEFLRGTVFLAL